MHGWETRMLLKYYLERGVSKAELSRRFGVSRRTIHEWVETGQLDRDLSSGGSRYAPRPPAPHKLDPYTGIIDARLEEYPGLSAQRLFDEVRGAASIGFHVRHLGGALDRLFTYARGEALSDTQKAAMRAEGDLVDPAPSLADVARHERVDRAGTRAASHDHPRRSADGTYSRAGRFADDDARPPVPRGRAQHAPRGAGDLDRQDPGRLLTARSPIGSPSPGFVRSRDTTPPVPPTLSRGPTHTVRVRRHRH